MKRLLVKSLLVVTLLSGANLNAQITNYSQDFEGLDANDTSSDQLGNDGWLVGANVFGPDGTTFIYNYFAFPAPNDGGGFSQIASGAAGPSQGTQYLNVFSDYNNGNHTDGSGFFIDANVFQERFLVAEDAGMDYEFRFDYRVADSPFGPADSMMTQAFIKVLDPGSDFALVGFEMTDTTMATTDWTENNVLSISILADESWTGFILQFGFVSNGCCGDPSGVYYDNVYFGEPLVTKECLKGDVNLDEIVNILDVAPFVDAISTGTFSCEADVNEDTMVDILDVSPFVALISGG